MTYEKNYMQHITTEYDEQFNANKDIKWDPWVGKEYHKTGVLILGMSTYVGGDAEWDNYASAHRDTSRQIVYNTAKNEFINGDLFQPVTKMFFDGVGVDASKQMLEKFWEAVAFNNFVQCAVPKESPLYALAQFQPEEMEKSRRALTATFDIIKPNFCLVLGVSVVDSSGLDGCITREEKINGTRPRVTPQNGNQPPIVGIRHSSDHFSPDQWLEFLQADPVSKKPVADFMDYLKRDPAD